MDNLLVAILAVLATVLAVAYYLCKLNKYLPVGYQKKCAPPTAGGNAGGNFVGAMAHSPSLVPCAFPQRSGPWMLNRCNYA